jgi:hypothetical protein
MMRGSTSKVCPDCAEEVRSEALKCRFCGYRFDLKRSGERTGHLASLLENLRRPPGPDTPYDLLAAWGVALPSGELVRHWLAARVTDAPGYLILTDRRLLFFERARRGHYELRRESLVANVSDVSLRRHGRVLCLSLDGQPVMFRGLAGDGASSALAFLLAA